MFGLSISTACPGVCVLFFVNNIIVVNRNGMFGIHIISNEYIHRVFVTFLL